MNLRSAASACATTDSLGLESYLHDSVLRRQCFQEQLLFLPAGDSPVHERFLRRMAGEKDWRRQLKMFDQLPITNTDGNPSGGP